ncbi:MAG TPA: hypothetical protein VGS27_30590 [Candidatus Sulfotelmatobacter sp.]|nr:hypothetical protein [Candidatus Sulfotelmatobacter sp.]
MATLSSSQPKWQHLTPGAYDRIFYSGMAVAMAATVFVGFAPTFYLRFYFHAPTPSGATSLTWLAQLHGALFSSWVVLFIVQTSLVAKHNVAMHRRLGIAGVLLAAAMTVVGLRTAINAAARGATPPGADPLAFLAIPMGDMLMFSIFVASAFFWRRNREAHKRLMLLAYISIVAAAVARLPGVLPPGPLWFYGLAFIFLLIAVVYDLGSRHRVHNAYVWGGTLLVASVPLRLMLSGTGTWRAIAHFLVGRLG